jgi:hypothetical protein
MNMSEKLYKHNETTIILNVQHSGIGYAYPRIFIKRKDGACANLDVTIGACFKMKPEDFEDWAKDAEIRTKEQFLQDFVDSGIKITLEKLDMWLKDVEEGA